MKSLHFAGPARMQSNTEQQMIGEPIRFKDSQQTTVNVNYGTAQDIGPHPVSVLRWIRGCGIAANLICLKVSVLGDLLFRHSTYFQPTDTFSTSTPEQANVSPNIADIYGLLDEGKLNLPSCHNTLNLTILLIRAGIIF